MRLNKLDSEFLRYLIDRDASAGEALPTLSDISTHLDISVGKLREELSVARLLGVVSLKPRAGMKREPFSFMAAILPGILFALASGEADFLHLSQMRRGLEVSLWHDAVAALQPADIDTLQSLIAAANDKLNRERIMIPHQEHREFHLTIFNRLDNPFVTGFLEAYWEAYEASEIGRYYTYAYWKDVWSFHARIVDALKAGDADLGLSLLLEHFNLLKTTPYSVTSNNGA